MVHKVRTRFWAHCWSQGQCYFRSLYIQVVSRGLRGGEPAAYPGSNNGPKTCGKPKHHIISPTRLHMKIYTCCHFPITLVPTNLVIWSFFQGPWLQQCAQNIWKNLDVISSFRCISAQKHMENLDILFFPMTLAPTKFPKDMETSRHTIIFPIRSSPETYEKSNYHIFVSKNLGSKSGPRNI